ncbi:SBBP repeat-containing protein, partial [bacterium]|nr:SBBP repeat-containing protein [bacterium]
MKKNIFILVLLLAGNLQAGFLHRSTLLGGSNDDVNWEIALDSSNNVYIAGYTASNDYPIVSGFQTVFTGWDGAFSKFNSDLSGLIYSTYLGGNGYDDFIGISVDVNENCYLSGGTFSADFPIVSGSWDTSYNGNGDAFISKLDATGSSLIYSTYLGSGEHEYSRGSSNDANGYLYLVGPTASVYFPTTAGAVSNVYGGGTFDIFATKLDQNGTGLVYSTFIGGTDYDHTW